MAEQQKLAKPFWQSTTLWLNVAALSAVVLQYALDTYVVDPDLQGIILAVLNIVNRFRTTSAVNLKI